MFRYLAWSASLLAGVFNASVALAAPASFDMEVKDPYIQAAPAGQAGSAAFMRLENTGRATHALTSVQSVVAESAQLQNAKDAVPLPRIEVPAGGQMELHADGPHIELSGLKEELKPGESVSLTLIFDDGSQTSVLAPVRAD